ncbi:MAG: TMEM165/GDT1 family protein, partial [Desulfovibrionales bacterium]
MDWKLLATTFGAIFVAELGDKTQLACILLAAETRKTWTVFLGATALYAAEDHLIMDYFVQKMATRRKERLDFAINAVFFFF